MKKNKPEVKKPDLKVFGVLEKRWGELPCAHSYEGAVSLAKLPKIPVN